MRRKNLKNKVKKLKSKDKQMSGQELASKGLFKRKRKKEFKIYKKQFKIETIFMQTNRFNWMIRIKNIQEEILMLKFRTKSLPKMKL